MSRLCTSAQAAVQSDPRQVVEKLGLLHPPGRETARFSSLIEEDDIAIGVAKPRLAPHPRLIAGAVLERNSAPRQLLHPLIQIVAFEIDRRCRDDFLFGIDLDREGYPS